MLCHAAVSGAPETRESATGAGCAKRPWKNF